MGPRILEVKKIMINSGLNFRRVTHFRQCLHETQVVDNSYNSLHFLAVSSELQGADSLLRPLQQ